MTVRTCDRAVYRVAGCFFFFKQKTAYEIYQCDWSSDVCSSDLSGGLIIDAQFGKQDMRGCFSITLIDNRHCVSSQKFFATKHEMLGYVVGYNEAKKIHGFDEIALYNIKEVA